MACSSKDGKMIREEEQIVGRWAEYFKDTLSTSLEDEETAAQEGRVELEVDNETNEEQSNGNSCNDVKATGIDTSEEGICALLMTNEREMKLIDECVDLKLAEDKVVYDSHKVNLLMEESKVPDVNLCSDLNGVSADKVAEMNIYGDDSFGINVLCQEDKVFNSELMCNFVEAASVDILEGKNSENQIVHAVVTEAWSEEVDMHNRIKEVIDAVKGISEGEKKVLCGLLYGYEDVFSDRPDNVTDLEYSIKMKPHEPIKCKLYIIPIDDWDANSSPESASLYSSVCAVWEIRFAHPTSRTFYASFKGLSLAIKQHPEKLSEAGFFYAINGDETACLHCGGGLKYWDDTDKLWVEYVVWLTKCLFVLLARGRDFVDNICQRRDAEVTAKVADNVKPPSNFQKTATEHLVTMRASDNAHMCETCFQDILLLALHVDLSFRGVL
ncbi:uncharacterized protein LOC126262868 [Schistocerca nitens]|uniref:uncharacterized protein LOC126262868 n=1 Tax=Schistocerca nitens TaxID=7011 RepID=UPI002118DD70|nr:uncharacterized protein LOC126262868 [Schistocerca nitens]